MKKLFCYRFSSMLLAGILMFSTCQKDEDKPVILRLSPESGRVGDAVMISGLLLGQATRVVFGTAEGAVIAADPKTVSTQVPDGLPTGKWSVTVETNSGISNPLEFTVIPSPPDITAVEPAKGSVGMRVILTGRNFSDVKEVTLGDQKITAFETSSPTQLAIKIPVNSTPGEKKVTVTTAGGVSKPATLTVVPPPSIASFSPMAGTAGKRILISGANLTGITAVYFQDVAAVFEVKSSMLIEAIVPQAAVTGKLKVVGEGGEGRSDADFVIEGAPAIASFAPATGTFTTEVTIDGDNFLPNAKVKFGNLYAKTIFITEQQLKATVPAGAVSGPIVVETVAGTGRSGDNFLVIPAPSIDRFAPLKGVAGTKITITGANFTDISSVKFNGAEAGQANITVHSMTSLDVKVPTQASTGTVQVTNPSGTGTSASVFTVVDPASALTFSPTQGPVGASITIAGFGFDNSSVVRFNGTAIGPGEFSLTSETSIQVLVPASSTTGKITVTTGNLTLSSPLDFMVVLPPSIKSFSPASGPVGTQVVVSGANFDNANVRLNGMAISSATVTSSTISFNVPAGASTGPITIQTPAGSVSSGNFTVIPPPQITSFSPSAAPAGSTVMIVGSNFNNASSVQFNGTEVGASNFQVNSSKMISAKVPVGATSGGITVTTPAGSYTTTSRFIVAPVVISFSPSSGTIGTPVSISGVNFDNATRVSFNGVRAIFTVQSATTLEATVPAGARTGVIAVTNAAGTGYSANSFGVAPAVTSIRPTAANVGATITIDGSGFTDVNSVALSNVSATFSVKSDKQITVKVPTAASGYIVVSNPAGSSKISFTVLPAPVLNSVTPSTTRAGSHIVLFGSDLDQITKVILGGVNAAIVRSSPTSLEVVVPQGAGTGQKKIVGYFAGLSTNGVYVNVVH